MHVKAQIGGNLLLKNDLELQAANPATTFLRADNKNNFTTTENIYKQNDNMQDLLKTYK